MCCTGKRVIVQEKLSLHASVNKGVVKKHLEVIVQLSFMVLSPARAALCTSQ